MTQWKNIQRIDLKYRIPEETFSKFKRITNDKSAFKKFHPFWWPLYILHEGLHTTNKETLKWDPISAGLFLGYSIEDVSNISYVLNPRIWNISLHIIYADDFSTIIFTKKLETVEMGKALF